MSHFILEGSALVAYGGFSSIPSLVAQKRRCKNMIGIELLCSYFSWTIIFWIVALAWASMERA